MKEKLLKQNVYLGFLVLLTTYHLLANFTWIAATTAPVPWDQAGHTRLAIQFADYFTSLGFLRIIDYFSISTYYPPLIHTIVGILIIFFGHPIQTGEIVITLFFGLSIFLIYVYSLDLFKNNRIALISAVIFSFLPIIYEHSRWFLLEIPQITFLLLCLIFLHRSRYFSDKKNTMYFFIALGFAALTKWTSLVYIFIPFIISAVHWYKNAAEHKNISKNSFFKYIFIFFLITAPWYLINFSTFISQSLPNLQGESSDPSKIMSVQNFIFYIYLFINFQTTIYLATIFIIATFYFFIKKKTDQKILFGTTMLFIYLVFSLISNKDWRYTLPILPFAAIIIAVFLDYIWDKLRVIGKVLIIILILFLISYHFLLSFRPQALTYQKAIKIPIVGWIDYINLNNNLVHAYDTSHWPQDQILSKLNVSRRKWFLCLVDQEKFNCSNLVLEREILGLKELNIEPPPTSNFSDEESANSYLDKYSYVLVTEEKIDNPANRNVNVFLQLKNAVKQKDSGFKKTKTYHLPNGDKVDLYESI